MKLIVGLGNPGKDYEYTRHNLGFLVVKLLSQKIGADLKLSSFTKGISSESMVNEKEVSLLMPLTFMNKSGWAVKQYIASALRMRTAVHTLG